MQLNRTTILAGPALVQYAGSSFWSKGDITLTPTIKTFDIATAAFGKVDKRRSNFTLDISFEPSGAFTGTLASVLWPYAATPIGSSIVGGTDKPLTIWTRDGKKLVVYNAVLSAMPPLSVSVGKTMIGTVKFTGILANNTDPANAAAYYSLTSVAYPGDTGFAVSDIKTFAVTAAWGASSPWSSFLADGGWDISFSQQNKEMEVDGLGTVDITLSDLTVTAKATPIGPAEADILAALAPNVSLGNSIAAAANPLNISATGFYARIYNAAIDASALMYGADKKRLGPTTWVATRTVTAGLADPLFYVGTTAPS